MATRKIPDIPAESRRWVNEEEAIGLLNITRREWEEYFKEHASVYVGKNYDMTQLHRLMERQVVVNRSGR